MDLTQAKRLIVFGGSFDPPHIAHEQLPALAMQAINAEVVVYVPAARQPLKLDTEHTSALHRLAMLRLAVQNLPNTVIFTDELDRASNGQPSYTINTLKALRHRLSQDARMRLLIGSDQLRLFDQWKNTSQIIAIAEPLVMIRPPDSREALLADLPEGFDRNEWSRRLLPMPLIDVSSTAIRRRVGQGMPIGGLVNERVERYIADHGLYQSHTDKEA